LRIRGFVIVILLAGCPRLGTAQGVANFSGVFLRERVEDRGVTTVITKTEDPLILDIKQDAGTIRVIEIQNGVETTDTYNLKGKATVNVGPDGVRSKDRVRFKHGLFVLKSEWGDPLCSGVGPVTEQNWSLSPDMQTLTIQPKIAPLGALPRGFQRIAIFKRQSSLQEALGRARAASGMNNCNAMPWPFTKGRAPITNKGASLGYTGFEELVWEVGFDADLSGDFFKGLTRTAGPSGVEFRKDGQPIDTYVGALSLEVTPYLRSHPRYLFSTMQRIMGWGYANLPEWLLTLRFRAKWAGPEGRDLGDVPSELRQEPWPELSVPQRWYRMEIPAQNVPLTDSLEIHILSASGNQLGCIRGHL
jgi:hypothetical protein